MPFCILTSCMIPETGFCPSASVWCISDLEYRIGLLLFSFGLMHVQFWWFDISSWLLNFVIDIPSYITTSSKQTRSLNVRIEIKTQVTLRMLLCICIHVAWIRTDGCSRISILFSVILNSLLRILFHVFYSSHSAYYVWLCSFLKLKTLLSDLEA